LTVCKRRQHTTTHHDVISKTLRQETHQAMRYSECERGRLYRIWPPPKVHLSVSIPHKKGYGVRVRVAVRFGNLSGFNGPPFRRFGRIRVRL